MKIPLAVLLLLTTGPAWAEPLPDGRYTGSDFGADLELRIKGKTASVQASSGGCAGEVSGKLSETGSGKWLVTAPAAPGETCKIRIEREGDGSLTLLEELGCGFWHGASCSFDGAVR